MLEKKVVKKLYIYYEESVDSYNEANKKYNLVKYCNHKATYKKQFDNIRDWIAYIVAHKFSIEFGLYLCCEDGSIISGAPIHCYTDKESEDNMFKIFSKIINIYFSDIIYYDIEADNICIMTELTGHSYRNSIHESCDSCINCNGLKCDSCRKLYIVADMDTGYIYYRGYNKEKAITIYENNKKDYTEYFNDVLIYHNPDMEYYNSIKDRTLKDLINLLDHENILYKY